jgi:hypothetical protein
MGRRQAAIRTKFLKSNGYRKMTVLPYLSPSSLRKVCGRTEELYLLGELLQANRKLDF